MSVSTAGQPQRIPLECIRLQPNIPAGFSPFRLLAIAVRRINDEDWPVVEGRHRGARILGGRLLDGALFGGVVMDLYRFPSLLGLDLIAAAWRERG